ncbi:MAG: leucine-rich repeat protein, partial [Ruthenibacterium sp.]
MDGEAKSTVKPYETATYKLTYTVNSDGTTVTITGITGTASGELVLPASIEEKPVTVIGYKAFYNCSIFTGNLTIPDSVTSIGSSAFENCKGFTGALKIPNNVTMIGDNAFGGCTGFTGGLTLPNHLTTIGDNAFDGCSGFTGSLTIPNGVTTIGGYAFSNCSGFTGSLMLSNSLTTIGDCAFDGCKGFTGSLTLPDSLTTMGTQAFSGCSGFTGSLTLSDNLTTIRGAFDGCSGFTGNLMLPNRLTTIDIRAFFGCSGFTGNLTLPNSVTTIGSNAFFGCSGFTGTLTLSASLSAVQENAFSGCGNITDVIVPPSVTTIADKAFENCNSLKTVHGLAKSYAQTWADSMKLSFEASEILGITLNKTELALGLYKSEKLVATVHPATAEQTVHWSSSDESSVTVTQDGIVTLMSTSYDYQPLTITAKLAGGPSATCVVTYSKDINDGICRPYPEAKYELTYVVKPDGTLCITGATNYRIGKIGKLVLPEIIDGKTVTAIEESAFRDCTGFTGSLTIPNSVTTIGNDAFDDCSGFTGSLTIPNSVTTIGSNAFDDCRGFTGGLTIPNSVTTIGNGAFDDCSGFTGSLMIPNSVTTIGSGAFSGCSGFKGNLTLPNSITTIESGAFSGCTGFTGNLTIPNSVTTIENDAFSGCSGFTGSLTLPNSVTTIESNIYGWGAFRGCSGFTGTLTLPNKLKRVEMSVFSGCSKITNVLVPPAVTYIDQDAFENCSSLKTVHGIAKSYAQAWAKIKGLDFKEYDFTGITLNKTKLSLIEGDSETLTATVLPENVTDKTVTWTSDKKDIATVGANGKVTAVKAGTATITAKTANGKSATCAVTVTAKKPDVVDVTGITLNETAFSLIVGENKTVTATVLPANATDKTVTWTSRNAAVA